MTGRPSVSALPVLPVLPTTVVGSHPQPEWLVDRAALKHRGPPRVRARELWRIADDHLEEAQDDATLAAIAEMERAGIDVVSDGEIRRESYSNRFATALDGIDPEQAGTAMSRAGTPDRVPLVTGPITRRQPVELRDAQFLRAATPRPVKITVPGPFTLSQQAEDRYYGSRRDLALAYATAVNEELRDLADAGVDVVQLDEPYLQSFVEDAKAYAVEAINAALAGVAAHGAITCVHTCFGYGYLVRTKTGGYPFLAELAGCAADQIAVETAQPRLDPAVLAALAPKTVVAGVIDLGALTVETAAQVAARVRAMLEVVEPERLWLSPDCGMKYLPRAVARAKLAALVDGVTMVRQELTATAGGAG